MTELARATQRLIVAVRRFGRAARVANEAQFVRTMQVSRMFVRRGSVAYADPTGETVADEFRLACREAALQAARAVESIAAQLDDATDALRSALGPIFREPFDDEANASAS